MIGLWYIRFEPRVMNRILAWAMGSGGGLTDALCVAGVGFAVVVGAV